MAESALNLQSYYHRVFASNDERFFLQSHCNNIMIKAIRYLFTNDGLNWASLSHTSIKLILKGWFSRQRKSAFPSDYQSSFRMVKEWSKLQWLATINKVFHLKLQVNLTELASHKNSCHTVLWRRRSPSRVIRHLVSSTVIKNKTSSSYGSNSAVWH